MQTNEAVALWKELGITTANMEFSCGGDSMNDYHFSFYNSENKEVKSGELESFFDDEVFRKVDFYVNSDGHYIGEFGNVTIELNDDEEEGGFVYYKSSQSEWSESYTEHIKIELTEKEIEFLNNKVLNLVGNQDGNAINYKGDCILSDEEEIISQTLLEKVTSEAENYEFEVNGEPEDWYSFTTSDEDESGGIFFNGNKLIVQVNRNFTIITDEV